MTNTTTKIYKIKIKDIIFNYNIILETCGDDPDYRLSPTSRAFHEKIDCEGEYLFEININIKCKLEKVDKINDNDIIVFDGKFDTHKMIVNEDDIVINENNYKDKFNNILKQNVHNYRIKGIKSLDDIKNKLKQEFNNISHKYNVPFMESYILIDEHGNEIDYVAFPKYVKINKLLNINIDSYNKIYKDDYINKIKEFNNISDEYIQIIHPYSENSEYQTFIMYIDEDEIKSNMIEVWGQYYVHKNIFDKVKILMDQERNKIKNKTRDNLLKGIEYMRLIDNKQYIIGKLKNVPDYINMGESYFKNLGLDKEYNEYMKMLDKWEVYYHPIIDAFMICINKDNPPTIIKIKKDKIPDNKIGLFIGKGGNNIKKYALDMNVHKIILID